jgi:hypothetical protein
MLSVSSEHTVVPTDVTVFSKASCYKLTMGQKLSYYIGCEMIVGKNTWTPARPRIIQRWDNIQRSHNFALRPPRIEKYQAKST